MGKQKVFYGTIFILLLVTSFPCNGCGREDVQIPTTIPSTTPAITVRAGDSKATLFPSGPASPITQPSQATRDIMQHISQGAERFGLEFLTRLQDILKQTNIVTNVVVSPFALWSLLISLLEGASERTLEQLRTALHLEDDIPSMRVGFQTIFSYLQSNTSTIEVASLQALFTEINQPPDPEFERVISRFYGSVIIPVNFHDPVDTVHKINEEARKATRGLIQYTVLPQDLVNANLVLISSLYFKGQWKHPFNETLTKNETFYDEEGKPIGMIEMMAQEANFNYVGINELEAHVLELPYGDLGRLSMLILLPKKGVSLNKVTHNLENVGITRIFEKLEAAAVGYEDDNVEVFLPKFTTSSDLQLQVLLEKMGITDIFNENTARLDKISASAYVKQIIQTVKIIVNEQGTEAGAVTTAVLANKATPPKFYLNRPFIYLIVDKTTKLLLFAGHLQKPLDI